MIFRKYGRRSSRDLGDNSIDAAVSDSSSSQDFCDLTILSPGKSDKGCGMGLWESRKSEIIDLDKDPYGSTSSQESKGLSVLEVSDGGFQKSKKLKKVSSDPFDYNSSDDVTVLPKGVSGSSSVFDFSEEGDVWKENKFKNASLDSYGSDLGILQTRNHKGGVKYGGFNGKIKKPRREDRAPVVSKNKENKRKNKKNKKIELVECEPSYAGNMTTLMETQEFGEMMEHTDEVDFALGGLKTGQPLKVRRASLLKLLSICGTSQQRRLLRAHGMTKTISHAVLELTLDDPPSNLAAAALLYILTSDDQDDHLLNSPSCLRFLIKLLKPLKSNSSVEEKPLLVGSRLLGMCKASIIQDSAKEKDSSSAAILLKVQEILVNCKDMKPRTTGNFGRDEPELNPKWISLLTMEKACSSKISLEDIPTIFRKPGGKFKENLRESGGLDAVFEVARKWHSTMQEWLEKSPTFALPSEDISGLESLMLLLKCLKIMENATFLSKDNQGHLLQMRGNNGGHQAPRTLIKLVLSVTKILSGILISRSFLENSQGESCGPSIHSGGSYPEGSSQRTFDTPLSNECFEPSQVSTDSVLLKLRVESSAAGSTSGSSNSLMKSSRDDSQSKRGIQKQKLIQRNTGITEEYADPFAFDEEELKLSKWDLLSGDIDVSMSQGSKETAGEYNNGSHSILMFSQQESNNVESQNSQEESCSTAADEDLSKLLEDCLVTAVKVLMNLTNDNIEGCQQIASGGGLEILSSLIAGHFPSFRSYLPHSGLLSNPISGLNQRTNTFLNDDELDFLVAILGLLVNLVEKDHKNRSRLAAAKVSLPSSRSLDAKERIDAISLFCSIFLANQGASEAAAEGKSSAMEDEASLLMGEKEAEKMIVEGYSALLLAFLSTESKSTRNAISECLPKRNIAILVPVLERFVGFHSTLNVISPETHRTVLEVIESCRIP